MKVYRVASLALTYENGVSMRRYMMSSEMPHLENVSDLDQRLLFDSGVTSVEKSKERNRSTNIKRNLVDSDFEPLQSNGIEIVCYDVHIKGVSRPKSVDFAIVND